MKARYFRGIASVVGAMLSLSILNPVSAYAQATAPAATPAPTPVRAAPVTNIRRFERLDALLAQLNLGEGQKTRIGGIELNAHRQIMALRFNRTLTPLQRQEQVRVLVKSTVDQIRMILLPAQRRRFRNLALQARQSRAEVKPASSGATTPTPAPPSTVTADGDQVEF